MDESISKTNGQQKKNVRFVVSQPQRLNFPKPTIYSEQLFDTGLQNAYYRDLLNYFKTENFNKLSEAQKAMRNDPKIRRGFLERIKTELLKALRGA